jgi:hypothetical protein
MAAPQAPLPNLAAVEAPLHEGQEPNEARTGGTTRLEIGDQRPRRVVECKSVTYERGIPKVLL